MSIQAMIEDLPKFNSPTVAAFATKEFHDGWLTAEAECGRREYNMWFVWLESNSIFACGYLAACEYLWGVSQ